MDNFFRYFPKLRGGSELWSNNTPASDVLINGTFGAAPQDLTAPLLSNSNTVYAPTITAGAVTVTAGLLENVSILYSPSIQAGAVTLNCPLLLNTSIFYPPNITVTESGYNVAATERREIGGYYNYDSSKKNKDRLKREDEEVMAIIHTFISWVV